MHLSGLNRYVKEKALFGKWFSVSVTFKENEETNEDEEEYKKQRSSEFSLHPLWYYRLDPRHCLHHCGASWRWRFCFSPPWWPSLAGLVMISLIRDGESRCSNTLLLVFAHLHEQRVCPCLTLTCRCNKLVFSCATIIAVAGANRLFLLLVCDNSLPRTLENGLNDDRVLIDLQRSTQTRACR